MKNINRRLAVAFIVLAGSCSVVAQTERAEPTCTQEKVLVYLKVLRVTSCLIEKIVRNDAGGTRHVATHGVQRIENIGSRDVTLEVREDYFKGPFMNVYSEGRRLSRGLVVPRLHDDTYVNPQRQQYPLRVGASVVFKVEVKDVLEQAPEQGVEYTIFMSAKYAFRYADEPVGHGAILRQDEMNRTGQFVQSVKFEGVLLR